MSIIRTVHNRENPYVMLNKSALFNKNISLKAIGLWARCMARPTDWSFNISEMASSGKEGKRAIYSAIDELIENGYAMRLEYFEKNTDGKFTKGGVEYVFFEFEATEEEKLFHIEEFKKSFRQCGFGDLHNGNLRNAPLLIKEEETEERKETNKTSPKKLGDRPTAAPKDASSKQLKNKSLIEIPSEASKLAQDLLNHIKRCHPKAKDPDLVKWALEIEKAHRIDNRSWEDLRAVMDWAFEHAFWCTTLQSADGLRRNFDKMWLQMSPPDNRGNRVKKNRETAISLINYLKSKGINNEASLMSDGLYCIKRKDLIKFDLSCETFDELICKFFNVSLK